MNTIDLGIVLAAVGFLFVVHYKELITKIQRVLFAVGVLCIYVGAFILLTSDSI